MLDIVDLSCAGAFITWFAFPRFAERCLNVVNALSLLDHLRDARVLTASWWGEKQDVWKGLPLRQKVLLILLACVVFWAIYISARPVRASVPKFRFTKSPLGDWQVVDTDGTVADCKAWDDQMAQRYASRWVRSSGTDRKDAALDEKKEGRNRWGGKDVWHQMHTAPAKSSHSSDWKKRIHLSSDPDEEEVLKTALMEDEEGNWWLYDEEYDSYTAYEDPRNARHEQELGGLVLSFEEVCDRFFDGDREAQIYDTMSKFHWREFEKHTEYLKWKEYQDRHNMNLPPPPVEHKEAAPDGMVSVPAGVAAVLVEHEKASGSVLKPDLSADMIEITKRVSTEVKETIVPWLNEVITKVTSRTDEWLDVVRPLSERLEKLESSVARLGQKSDSANDKLKKILADEKAAQDRLAASLQPEVKEAAHSPLQPQDVAYVDCVDEKGEHVFWGAPIGNYVLLPRHDVTRVKSLRVGGKDFPFDAKLLEREYVYPKGALPVKSVPASKVASPDEIEKSGICYFDAGQGRHSSDRILSVQGDAVYGLWNSQEGDCGRILWCRVGNAFKVAGIHESALQGRNCARIPTLAVPPNAQ
jgi:hypothetical protein